MIESPLVIQMKHTISRGMLGFRIFEHNGDSGTVYKAGDNVPVGAEYVNDGKTLPADYIEEATHTHKDTEIKIDGVSVKVKFMTSEEADDLDDELF